MELVDWIVKQTGKISDNFNKYKFYVKQQPQIIDSSSMVSIHTFSSRDMDATIPCSFKWFTIRNNVTTQIQHFKGNTYICEPADVGCQLQVQITSSDPQSPGTALMTYGPVKFDVLLKKQIQMGLSTGESTFLVDIDQNDMQKQCQLKVFQQRLIISHINSQTSLTFHYGMIEPKLQVMHKIPTKIRIIFSPKHYQELQRFLNKLLCREVPMNQVAKNPFLQINFHNRKAKDSFIFITKAFNTKKELKATAYVSNLEKQLDFTKLSQKNHKTFDYIEHISQLQRDINKLLEINSKNYMEKRVYLEENKKLQNEIQEIVSTYVKIIEEKFSNREDFEKSFIVLKEKEQQIKNNKIQQQVINDYETKIAELQQENQQLKLTLSKFNMNQGIIDHNTNQQANHSDPFKKKSFVKTMPFKVVEASNQFQNESNEDLSKVNQHLRRQLQQMSSKYEHLQKQYEPIMTTNVNPNTNNLSNGNKQANFNMDLYDAKSVRSVRDKNHNESHVSQSLLFSKDSMMINPQRLKFVSMSMQKPTSPYAQSNSELQQHVQQNLELKQQIIHLQQQMQTMTSQFQQKQQKYKKRISELNQQLSIYKRNNDVLNRSQHLSMEMEDYNQEQQDMLKKDNEYLRNEVQNYKQLCQKYMTDAKKYKQLKNETLEKSSSILQEAGI